MKSNFLTHQRSAFKKKLKKGVDVLIIGGGINGAGIARDAAMRGFKTGLLEKNDFASGSSSKSSKLIHGGIRYLEHMDFSLVMESCAERALLLKLAPELVKPVEFLMPVYKSDRYGMFLMNIGMWMYDFLSFFRNYKLHKKLSAQSILQYMPKINPKGLKGGFIYYDSLVNDSRLVINNIVSAHNNRASLLNYCEVVRFQKARGKISGVFAVDRLSKDEFYVPCKTIVSAAGPWTNSLYLKIEGVQRELLCLTKGIHLVFPREKIHTKTAVVIISNNDKRIVFVIPWKEYTLVGTTDTDFNDDVDNVYSKKEDVLYLLDMVNRKFCGLFLKPEDAISCYAGLRPLLISQKDSNAVSRKDKILRSPSKIFIVGGGKLTTYRKISEKAVNMIAEELCGGYRPCQTKKVPLMEKIKSQESDRFNINKDVKKYLQRRYGNGYIKLIQIIKKKSEMAEKIYENLPFIFAEIEYGAINELLVHIKDFFRLRTEIFLKAQDNGLLMLDKCAGILGENLGLEQKEINTQIKEYKQFVHNSLNCLRR